MLSYEQKKKWLKRYREQFKKTEKYKMLAREWQECIEVPGAKVLDGMPHGTNMDNGLDSKIIKLNFLWDRYYEARERTKKILDTTMTAIDALEDEKQRDVLYYRYVFKKDWTEIEEILDCSESYVFELHKKGVQNINILEK